MMESYSDMYSETKNKWKSQHISKQFKNRHRRKSHFTKTQSHRVKQLNNRRNRDFANTTTKLTQTQSNISTDEWQFISYNYYQIQVTVYFDFQACVKSTRTICKGDEANIKPHIKNLFKSTSNTPETNKSTVPLSSTEWRALDYVQRTASIKSAGFKGSLIEKIKSLQFRNNEKLQKACAMFPARMCDRLRNFIKNEVPLIIHIKANELIPKLLNDTHYRNLFEVGSSGGCTNTGTRASFEHEMFRNCYDDAPAKERPKYGALNVGLQSSGCRLASSYGSAFFKLRDTTVRWRVSITNQDSFSAKGVFGTLSKCDHLLHHLEDSELAEMCQIVLQNTTGTTEQRNYREMQIHGPLVLNRDISSLNIPMHSPTGVKEKCEAFVAKNKCSLVYF
jgi:hypothetical protein